MKSVQSYLLTVISLSTGMLVFSDKADLLLEEDSSGTVNMSSDNLLKLRKLYGLVSAVELLYIYQPEISVTR